jgi:dolichol kinase
MDIATAGICGEFFGASSMFPLGDHSLVGTQTLRYTLAVGLSSTLEALSAQNDNLTLPLYMWSILILSDVG